VVLKDSQMLHWETYAEFADRKNPEGTILRAGAQAVAALAGDPAGMAVGTPGDASSAVKMLAVAADEAGPFLLPTRETLVAWSYAFARPIVACVDRPAGTALDPKVRALLEFVLSAAGQRVIEPAGGYLPLSPDRADAERAKLR
jgi:ABC-type phosphate transport system substrate-binding protein